MFKKLSFELIVIALLVFFGALVAFTGERGRVMCPTENQYYFTIADSSTLDTSWTFNNWWPNYSTAYVGFYATQAEDSADITLLWYHSFDQQHWLFGDSSQALQDTGVLQLDTCGIVAPYFQWRILGNEGNDASTGTQVIIDYFAR